MTYVRAIFFCLVLLICIGLSGVSYARYDFSVYTSKIISQDERQYGLFFVPKLTVTFLKVGQGDATLIVLPNGKTILVDGGPHEAGEAVIHKLIQKGIKQLDLVVSTHPDMDHIGGLIPVIQQIPVNMVLDSGKDYYSLTYRMYIKSIRKRNIPFIFAKEGQYLPLDPNVSIQVLNNGKEKIENNESSIVLKIRYKKADFLLMADADTKTEKEVIRTYDVHADVLKIGHHGSYTSSSKVFLQKVSPQFVVISYEKGNPYGHPHRSVIKRLNRYGLQIYTTAFRDIEFQTDGDNIKIQSGMPLPLLK
jgi:beta-lactamase superfamily II metal-dependent hydrolase